MISAYINYFNDYAMLCKVIENIDKYVSEIIIVDGPFSWCVDNFRKFGISTNDNTKQICAINDKIKYFYDIWETEEQKRIFGYDKCTHNIIMAIDSDEFLDIDSRELTHFIKSDNVAVAGLRVINLCNFFYSFSPGEPRKNVLFKKDIIDSQSHLDYLWLVGCKQKTPNYSIIFNYEKTIMYHCSLLRSEDSLLTKYIFYCSLYNKVHNVNDYCFKFMDDIAIEIQRKIFTRSRIEGLGLPSNLTVYDNIRPIDEASAEVPTLNFCGYNTNLRNQIVSFEKYDNFYIKNGDNIVNDYSFFSVVQNRKTLRIEFDSNIHKLSYRFLNLKYDTSEETMQFIDKYPENMTINIDIPQTDFTVLKTILEIILQSENQCSKITNITYTD